MALIAHDPKLVYYILTCYRSLTKRSLHQRVESRSLGPHDHLVVNIGALIIRMGFGGILYYIYNKEPAKTLF